LLHHLVDALKAYGPWGVFVLALLDSAGIPVPAAMDFLLLGIGWQSPNQAYFAAVLATVGSLVGNAGLFWAARGGARRWVKAVPEPDKPQRFRAWFRRYGLVTVFIPALFPIIPLPLKVFVISAGVLHSQPTRFLAVILLARVIRYFGLAYLGIQLGENAGYFLRHNAFAITGVAVGVALGLVLLIKLNDRRAGNATMS
jgi:membrane protein YqaA with SNARE-associated domain